jgi:hypothetical protein
MKKQFTFFASLRRIILFVALLSGLSLWSQTVPEMMYFKFDAPGAQLNSASAPVGTNPAPLTGLTVGGTGQFGTALQGTGAAGNYMSTGWATTMPNTGWTISMWLNGLPSNTTLYYLFGDNTANSFRCFLGGAAGAGNVLLRGGGLTDVNVPSVAPGPTVVTFVYTGSAVRYFKNGVYVGQVTQPTLAITGTGPFRIGSYSTNAGLPSGGLMDEYRMYNRALSDAEVGATWNIQLANGPTVTTNAATAVTGNSATLNGSVNANGNSTSVTFQYGLTTAYGNTVAGVPATVTGTSATAVTAAITGLSPNTLYHFRVNGTNSNGTANGNDLTFTTGAAPPTVVTTAATGVALTTATLNGTVNANSSSTTVTFQYGLTTAYGSTVTAVPSPVTGTSVTPVSAALTGLAPNSLYHFRVVGTSSGGTSNGNDMTFSTASPPTVVTNIPSNITNTSAQLNGTVTANGDATTTSFQWGLTTAYGNSIAATPSPVTGATPVSVSAGLTGLTINITYHYRCVGVNGAGTTYGLDQTFTTGCIPPGTPGGLTGPVNVCGGSTGNTYTITAVPNASSYNWFVPAGATITSGQGTTGITVTMGNTSGSVYVQAVGSCGGGPYAFLYVNVNPQPAPTITGSNTVCQGLTATYSTQTGMSGYSWTVSSGGTIQSGAGTSSVVVKWNNAGAQSVSVNYANSFGCSAPTATSYPVTVNAGSSPSITGTTSLCAGSGYYNYATQAGYSGYTWNVTSGGIVTSGQGTNTLTVMWNNPGPQSVSVNYAASNGCNAVTPANLPVTVNGVPGPAGSITGTSSVCAGGQGNYSCAPVAGATAYAWTLPSGYNITAGAGTNSITVGFDQTATSGSITVAGNTVCGSGSTSPPFSVTVNSLPAAAGAVSGPSSVCTGAAGVVYSVASISGASGYTWSLPAGATITAGQNTNSITVSFGSTAGSGNVTVFGTNSCGNGSVSAPLAVTISAKPAKPTVTANGNVLTSSASAGNQWYHDGTAVAGATSQTYTVPANAAGWYWTIVTVNGCPSDSSNHVYVAGVGITELGGGRISVYPVPNSGVFTIFMDYQKETLLDVKVYNEIGSLVYSSPQVRASNGTELNVDLRPASPGVYSVVLTANGNRLTRKILIRD